MKQRPGVLEAKSCIAHINQSVEGFEDYIIKTCTNTGVWIVEKHDLQSGQILALYDFVNREYSATGLENDSLSIDLLGENDKNAFWALQKSINKALLKNYE